VRNGRTAAFWHRAASPPGSLRASLCAGMTISMDTGQTPLSGDVVTTAKAGQRFPY